MLLGFISVPSQAHPTLSPGVEARARENWEGGRGRNPKRAFPPGVLSIGERWPFWEASPQLTKAALTPLTIFSKPPSSLTHRDSGSQTSLSRFPSPAFRRAKVRLVLGRCLGAVGKGRRKAA